MNIVILVGRLGKDPETSYTQGGTACTKVSLATTEKYTDNTGQLKEKTEWHNLIVWGKRGETFAKFLSKGSFVLIRGKLQTTSWMDDKIGQKRYMTQIVVNEFEFGPKTNAAGGNGGGRSSDNRNGGDDGPVGYDEGQGSNYSAADMMNDDDIPF